MAPETPPARPSRSEPPPLRCTAPAPQKSGFENLEDEMASLLGRPKTSFVRPSASPRRVLFSAILTAAGSLADPAHGAGHQHQSRPGAGGGVTERAIQLIALLTVLSIAPSILIMMTSFTRIVVVLSLLRTALGTATAPPNSVIIALAMFLTAFVMGPVLQRSYDDGIKPLVANQISVEEALQNALGAAARLHAEERAREGPEAVHGSLRRAAAGDAGDLSLRILVPAFMISELKRAFEIGFLLFLPFLIIDLVVASVLMSMGMMMLPPVVVSLPFKLIFFVLVDGWSLVAGSLVQSYGGATAGRLRRAHTVPNESVYWVSICCGLGLDRKFKVRLVPSCTMDRKRIFAAKRIHRVRTMAGQPIGDMDVEYATTIADRAIRLMSQQSVPATPKQFRGLVRILHWAVHCPLRKTIDILIAGKRKFDTATNHELFITYITPHSAPNPLAGLPEQLSGLIACAQQFLNTAVTDNRTHIEALGEVSSQAATSADPGRSSRSSSTNCQRQRREPRPRWRQTSPPPRRNWTRSATR